MKRRTLLAGIGASVAAVSGCVSNGGTDGGETGENETRADGDATGSSPELDANRPHCEIEPETIEVDGEIYESVGTIPYPEPPEEFTAEQVTEFVEEHERAYIRHSYLCDTPEQNVIRYDYSTEHHWLLEDGDSVTVALVYIGGATEGIDENGDRWMADIGPTGVVYTITESDAARVEFHELAAFDPDADIEDEIPDPVEEGETVVEF